jgi:hypothetical protein
MAAISMVCVWPSSRVDGGEINAATREYVRQMKAGGGTAPAKVDLKELIARGLLKPADVSAFDGAEVTVALTEDVQPGTALMSARMPDGTVAALLGDGSVQQTAR